MSRIQDAYGDWLNTFEWDWWCTLTFRLTPSSRTSLRHFRRFSRVLEKDLGRTGFRAFVASETGGLGGREHLHGLIRIGDKTRQCGLCESARQGAFRWWKDKYGRALILPYDSERGATHYVSKYITKSLAEYDFLGEYWDHEPR